MTLLEFMAGNPWLTFGLVCVVCMTIAAVCSSFMEPIHYRLYLKRTYPPRPPTSDTPATAAVEVAP